MKHLKKLWELLLSWLNAGEVNKPSFLNDETLEEREIRKDEIIKREKVKGTPFTIIRQQDKTFISLGMYKVSQEMSYKECKQAIAEKEWTLILNVARLIAMDEIAVSNETRKAIHEQTKNTLVNGQQKSNRYK